MDDLILRVTGITTLFLCLLIWGVLELRRRRLHRSSSVNSVNSVTNSEKSVEQIISYAQEVQIPDIHIASISCFVLLSTEGGFEKEWHVPGATSFLIGKGTVSNEVDMELGDTHFCEYISTEHAVLNFIAGCWYIEDLDSLNGVGIRKKGEEFALRLKPGVPQKVDIGDVIYISKAKIMVM